MISMTNRVHLWILALLAGLSSGTASWAADPVGAVKIENETNVELKITKLKCTGADGQEKTLDYEWKIPANSNLYLVVKDEKIYASRIEYEVTTTDGTTKGWNVKGNQLKAYGDFPSRFSKENLAVHRKELGVKTVEVMKPAGPDPARLANAEADVSRLQGAVNRAREDVTGARLAEALAVTAYNNTEAGSAAEFLASIAVAAARQELSKAQSALRSAESALQAATDRLNTIKYSSDR